MGADKQSSALAEAVAAMVAIQWAITLEAQHVEAMFDNLIVGNAAQAARDRPMQHGLGQV